MKFIERLFQRYQPLRADITQPTDAEASQVPPLAESLTDPFHLDPTHLYSKVGEGELATNCATCSGPYQGATEQECAYCGTGRSVFYHDITQKPESVVQGDNSEVMDFPVFVGNNTVLGDSVHGVFAFGDIVQVGEESSLLGVAGNSVSIGDYSAVTTTVGQDVRVGEEFNSNINEDRIFAETLRVGVDGRLGTVIIADNGKAVFFDRVTIQHLILGRNCKVEFGDEIVIDLYNYLTVPTVRSGDDLNIREEGRIYGVEYLKEVAETLRGLSDTDE